MKRFFGFRFRIPSVSAFCLFCLLNHVIPKGAHTYWAVVCKDPDNLRDQKKKSQREEKTDNKVLIREEDLTYIYCIE